MPQQIGLVRVPPLLVLLRVGTHCASTAGFAAAFPAAVTLGRMPLRFLMAAHAIVATYSASRVAAFLSEETAGATPFQQAMPLWFDFAHDQGLGCITLAMAGRAARDVAGCVGGQDEGWMSDNGAAAACVLAEVAVWLGFLVFAFMAAASLITGFRDPRLLVTYRRLRVPAATTVPPPASS